MRFDSMSKGLKFCYFPMDMVDIVFKAQNQSSLPFRRLGFYDGFDKVKNLLSTGRVFGCEVVRSTCSSRLTILGQIIAVRIMIGISG